MTLRLGRCVALALLATAVGGCDEEQITVGEPRLALSPEPGSLAWGTVDFDSPIEPKVIQIRNVGMAPLSLDWVVVRGRDDQLFSTSELPPVLAPGEQTALTVTFSPPRISEVVQAELHLTTNDPSRPEVMYPMSALLQPVCQLRALPAEVHTRVDEPVEIKAMAREARCRILRAAIDNRYFSLMPPLIEAVDLEPGAYWSTRLVQHAVGVPPESQSVRFITSEGPGARMTIRPETAESDCVRLEPAGVIFPGPVLLGRTSERTFRLVNDCDAMIAIDRLSTGAAAFSLVSDVPTEIAGQSDLELTVVFTPDQAGEHRSRLTLETSDPARPQLHGSMVAMADEEAVFVRPTTITFSGAPYQPEPDGVSACGSPVRDLTVYNATNSTVAVSELAVTGDERFAIVGAALGHSAVPWSNLAIPARTEATIALRFFPSRALPALHAGALTANIENTAVEIDLEGATVAAMPFEERFIQSEAPRTDVLFVVDQSGSMREERARLERNLSAFLDQAARTDSDLRIGLTTADATGPNAGTLHGCSPHPSYVDHSYADAETRSNALRCALYTLPPGSPIEAGLGAAQRAITRALQPRPEGGSTDPNAGFIREDASLAVIVVSDEDDQSSGTDAELAAAIRETKLGRPGLFARLHAIVGAPDQIGCPDAKPAPRYARIAERLDGEIHSICREDWFPILQTLGRLVVATRNRFPLAQRANPITMSVSVDGTSIPRTRTTVSRTTAPKTR